MVRFRVYYTDGVLDDNASPYDIEHRSSVQVIVQPDNEHNWVTVTGYDFYMWDDRGGFRWFGGDVFGLHDYLLQPGLKCVLFGEHIDTARYRAILNQAIAERGEKTGYNRTERKPDG